MTCIVVGGFLQTSVFAPTKAAYPGLQHGGWPAMAQDVAERPAFNPVKQRSTG